MRFFKRISVLLAVCSGILSCVSEAVPDKPDAPAPAEPNTVFTSSLGGVKVTLDGLKLYWAAGDEISVCEHIAADGQKGAIFRTDSAGARTTFYGNLDSFEKHWAVYPASSVKNWKNDGTGAAYLTLPSIQTAVRDGIDPAVMIMSAKTDSREMNFPFRPAVALIRIDIGEDSPALTAVALKAPSQYLAGSVSIRVSDTNPPVNGYGGKTSEVRLSCPDNAVFLKGSYYMAVIPRTYSKLEFSFTSLSGQTVARSLENVTLKAGTVYSIGQVPNMFDTGHVETYRYSSQLEPSSMYRVWAEDENQFVYPTDEPHICTFGADREVDVIVEMAGNSNPSSVVVRPLSGNYSPIIQNGKVSMRLKPFDRVSVEIDGNTTNPLFIFVNPFETDKPDKKSSSVKYYEAGYYNASSTGVNMTNLGKKELYLEGGAVLVGNIAVKEDSGVTLAGYGIIDARKTTALGVNISNSSDISLSGLTLINSVEGSTRFMECSGITADNYKVVATANTKNPTGVENDAFDMFGCDNVTLTRCFGYAHDDVYVIASKSFKKGWARECHTITIDGCIGWNVRGGNTFEIGYATALDVHDVTFKNCSAIHTNTERAEKSQFSKGAMAIHSCSLGSVHDITFENICVEDSKCYAIALEIKKSPFDEFPDPGYVPGELKDITFRNIKVLYAADGSYCKGYDGAHRIDRVSFENYNNCGTIATDVESAGIGICSNFSNFSFGSSAPPAEDKVETYRYSDTLESSSKYDVSVEGLTQFVYPTSTLDNYDEQLHICQFGCSEEVEVKVGLKDADASSAVVRPVSIDWSSSFSGRNLTLRMKPGGRAIVEFNGDGKHQLLLFANRIDSTRPNNPRYYFRAGGVYDLEQVNLGSGETFYIEGGAVVRTTIRAKNAQNVTVAGSGILDASGIEAYSIYTRNSPGFSLSGICAIGRCAPVTFLSSSDGSTLSDYKAVALFSTRKKSGGENDALDIVSCDHVRVNRGFAYSHDDCCIVKSGLVLDGVHYEGTSTDIVVDDYISAYRDSGHGAGVGYSCFEEVGDVTFRNIYVPYEVTPTSTFTRKGQLAVHNTGCADVHDITFENVWLEQASKGQGIYSGIFKYESYDYGDAGYVPGKIRNLTYRNVHMDAKPAYHGNYLAGYSNSNPIDGVTFDGLWYGGKRIDSLLDAGFYVTYTNSITFKNQ